MAMTRRVLILGDLETPPCISADAVYRVVFSDVGTAEVGNSDRIRLIDSGERSDLELTLARIARGELDAGSEVYFDGSSGDRLFGLFSVSISAMLGAKVLCQDGSGKIIEVGVSSRRLESPGLETVLGIIGRAKEGVSNQQLIIQLQARNMLPRDQPREDQGEQPQVTMSLVSAFAGTMPDKRPANLHKGLYQTLNSRFLTVLQDQGFIEKRGSTRDRRILITGQGADYLHRLGEDLSEGSNWEKWVRAAVEGLELEITYYAGSTPGETRWVRPTDIIQGEDGEYLLVGLDIGKKGATRRYKVDRMEVLGVRESRLRQSIETGQHLRHLYEEVGMAG